MGQLRRTISGSLKKSEVVPSGVTNTNLKRRKSSSKKKAGE